jgi:hypothetical protein
MTDNDGQKYIFLVESNIKLLFLAHTLINISYKLYKQLIINIL